MGEEDDFTSFIKAVSIRENSFAGRFLQECQAIKGLKKLVSLLKNKTSFICSHKKQLSPTEGAKATGTFDPSLVENPHKQKNTVETVKTAHSTSQIHITNI